MLNAINLTYAFRHYYPILTKKKIKSKFLDGTYSFIRSQIFILGHKMPGIMLNAWDTAKGRRKHSSFFQGSCIQLSRTCTHAHAYTRKHTNHVGLEELELGRLEEYFLTKPTSLSRWNPNSLYTNYEMEWKTKF